MAGLALTALFPANGGFGTLLHPARISVGNTIWGIALAMAFTSAAFVVCAVQPVLEDMDPALEQAAVTLGARPWAT